MFAMWRPTGNSTTNGGGQCRENRYAVAEIPRYLIDSAYSGRYGVAFSYGRQQHYRNIFDLGAWLGHKQAFT